MSKTNPNQDFYKVGGRSQTDGPDRNHSDVNADKHDLAQTDRNAKTVEHPAAMRSKKK